jgi:two-component system OmpR family sensor kinase
MKTIRRQLLVGLLCATIASAIGAGALLYHSLQVETGELADLQLRQLVSAMPDEFAPDASLPAPEDPEEEFILQVWDLKGRPLFASRPNPPTPNYNARGFSTVMIKGQAWRVYGELHHHLYAQASQPLQVRNEMAAHIALRTGLPLVGFVGVLVVLVLIVIGRAMGPLDRLARAVEDRSPSTLDPLSPAGWPSELAPVVQALNVLLAKFDETLGAQRIFVADAAHELRSPLTALKIQLQLAERATTPEARALAMAKLHERLDRSAHLVQQLLSLARFEAGHTAEQLQHVELGELLRATVADHAAIADSRGIDLGAVAYTPVHVQADPDGLRVLLNNLVDNALRYTQAGGRVDVVAELSAGWPVLRVCDNGPGVPPEQRERLFDRFYRPEGNAVWGAGLGLSIVRNIAHHHGAQVSLDEGAEGRGLCVTVKFAEQT